MELVEGGTLADSARARIALAREAITIARQIADALHAAHDRGIIHRDLKPANIAFTPNGHAKVLDFGLAKALVGRGMRRPSSPHATESGVVLGTAAYMSPEQARGQPLDKRSDIFAFGCVLFEMLTARNPFAGDTVSDVIVAILGREPDWTLLPAATPPRVQWLLRRCLEKDPKRRLHDIADARIELDEALMSPGDSGGIAAAVTGATRWAPASARSWRWMLAGVALLAGHRQLWRGAAARVPTRRPRDARGHSTAEPPDLRRAGAGDTLRGVAGRPKVAFVGTAPGGRIDAVGSTAGFSRRTADRRDRRRDLSVLVRRFAPGRIHLEGVQRDHRAVWSS